MPNTKSKKTNFSKKAFTLIEMLVVLSIFGIVTSAIMANYAQFGNKTLLKNLAYNIALNLREAQVSGLTGRNLNVDQGSYSTAYGIYFSSDKSFISFSDDNLNYKYDSGEEKKSFSIGRGHKISKLCLLDDNYACTQVGALHISFRRPEPDAYIYGDSSGPYARAAVEVKAPSGYTLYVLIESSGQISVQRTLK